MATTDSRYGLNAAVADELRGEARARRRTLDDLAEASGLSKASVQRYLAGTRDIRVDDLAALADALGSDPVTLMTRAAERLARDDRGVSAEVVEARFGGVPAAAKYSLDAAALERPTSHHDEDVAFEDQP